MREIYTDFLPIGAHLFGLNIPHPLQPLGSRWVEQSLQRSSHALSSLLLALKMSPVIRYQVEMLNLVTLICVHFPPKISFLFFKVENFFLVYLFYNNNPNVLQSSRLRQFILDICKGPNNLKAPK